MNDWRWISNDAAIAIHEEQLAEWGGGAGTRDEGAILSALARPQNLLAYGEPDAASLAAAYAYGVAKNHPFIDGNKRTAWVLARLFLLKNGIVFKYRDTDAAITMLNLAAGEISQDEFAEWLRQGIDRA